MTAGGFLEDKREREQESIDRLSDSKITYQEECLLRLLDEIKDTYEKCSAYVRIYRECPSNLLEITHELDDKNKKLLSREKELKSLLKEKDKLIERLKLSVENQVKEKLVLEESLQKLDESWKLKIEKIKNNLKARYKRRYSKNEAKKEKIKKGKTKKIKHGKKTLKKGAMALAFEKAKKQ